MKVEFAFLIIFSVVCLGSIFTKSKVTAEKTEGADGTANGIGNVKKDCSVCGLENDGNHKSIVVDGDIVHPQYRYPWMVSLHTKQGNHTCGGALISQNYILTAAHCVLEDAYKDNKGRADGVEENPSPNGPIKYVTPDCIVIGFFTSTDNNTKPRSPVEKITPHPKFTIATLENDIAVIKLEKKIQCDQFSNPICLPPSKLEFDVGESTKMAGWGAEKFEDREASDELRYAQLKVVNFDECALSAEERERNNNLKNSVFCLSTVDGKPPCFGDSGGPMFKEYNGKAYAVGVASSQTSPICEPNSRVMYTSVSSFIDWISQETGLNTSQSAPENPKENEKKQNKNKENKTRTYKIEKDGVVFWVTIFEK